MRPADLPQADALRQIAGWNQRPADWQRFLDLSPAGCFVAEIDNQIVGSVTTIQYAGEVAWIGMLLVHPKSRGAGIGKALLTRAIEHLHKVPSIKLDATPLGENLYRKLGFREEWRLTRFKKEAGPGAYSARAAEIHHADLPEAISLDARAFGVSRSALFESLLSSAQCGIALKSEGRLRGFGLVRPGSIADYLGPVAAQSPEAANEIIPGLCRHDRPLYWDIPAPNHAATELAEKLGFTPERPLVRMYLGANDRPGDVSQYFAIADPSLG